MPVKWSAELDQTLFILVVDVMAIKVGPGDAQKIANLWPAKAGEKPTARAIQEHIGVLRKAVSKNFNVGGTAIANTPKKPFTKSVAPTPASKASSKGSNKRKRFNDDVNMEEDDDEYADLQSTFTPSARGKRAASVKSIKYADSEENEDEDGLEIKIKPELVDDDAGSTFSDAMEAGVRQYAAAAMDDDY